MATSKATGQRRRLEPAAYRPGASLEGICKVCGDCQPLRNSYGVPACGSCNRVFGNTVRNMVFTICERRDGRCRITATTRSCEFCWMSKCFESGMMTKRVPMRHDYFRRRYDRMHPTLSPDLPQVLDEKAAAFKDCLLFMEQHYYQWLRLSIHYNNQSLMDKKLLRERSYIRGTALQLVERSLVAHDVLWLHNCFFDPYSCAIPAIRRAASEILNFTIDCRAASINFEQFIKLKMMLALQDDANVSDRNEVPQAVFDMIYTIEGKMIDGLTGGQIYLENSENPSYISTSKLFQYNVMNPEFYLPRHSIHVIPEPEPRPYAKKIVFV